MKLGRNWNARTVVTSCILLFAWNSSVLGDLTFIYFGEGNLIQSYSPDIYTVRTVKSSYDGTPVLGIAYSPKEVRIYYSVRDVILRMGIDGNNEAVMFSSFSYGWMNALAVDRVTGNLYVATDVGYVLACTATSGRLVCTEILNTGIFFYGIVLDPSQGQMFLTGTTSNSIYRAQMDGSGFTTMLAGLGEPAGIALHLGWILWTDRVRNQVLTGPADGLSAVDIVQLQSGASPSGMTSSGDLVYWGSQGSRTLQSCTYTGMQLETHYTGTGAIGQLTLVNPFGFSEAGARNESSNPCDDQGCSHMCVLKGNESVRCLCPTGLWLGEDDKACVGARHY